MASNGRQLSREQRVALQEFAVRGDRGRASIFVGRKAELALIRDRIDLLIERQMGGESAPGAELTTVVQGTPGAGKSALLAKIAEDWPLAGKRRAVAVSLDPYVLKQPMPVFLQAVASRIEQVPGSVQFLRKFVSSQSFDLANTIHIKVGPGSPEFSGNEVPPIPSLASYIAANATFPYSALHGAVLGNGIAYIDHALSRCRDDEERSKLLQATDMRKRTPLMLAVELDTGRLVKHLVEVESRLPVALRSVEIRDSEGRTARDYATELGDDRIMALLERLQASE